MEIKMKKIILGLLIGFFSLNVSAGCWSGGVVYPTGAVNGTMICGADGYWRQK